MPISGMNTFVVQPNGDSDTNFSQLAQCVYSTTKSNMGQLFTRRYVAETGWSSWEKVMSNANILYRLSLESDKKYLVIYDNKTNAKLAHINTDAQF